MKQLSVIVCTYNREKYLYNVLKSIAENSLDASQYELIVINNNSTDSTPQICEHFRHDFPNIDFSVFFEACQGLSYARNRGIREAKTPILVYVDDDATVNCEYLKSYVDFFAANSKAFAAGGPILPVYETAEPQWMSRYTRQLLTAYLYKGNKVKIFRHGQFPGGGNAAYRKSVFERTGYFNPELGRKGNSLAGAEEKDIFDKMTCLGMPFYYIPTAILYHIIPERKLTKEYFDKLTFSIGQSERQRTKDVSNAKYLKVLMKEMSKWIATVLLLLGYSITLNFRKGWKLILFRKNVTKGLIKK